MQRVAVGACSLGVGAEGVVEVREFVELPFQLTKKVDHAGAVRPAAQQGHAVFVAFEQ